MHIFALETHPHTVSPSSTFRSVANSGQAQWAQRELTVSCLVHTGAWKPVCAQRVSGDSQEVVVKTRGLGEKGNREW